MTRSLYSLCLTFCFCRRTYRTVLLLLHTYFNKQSGIAKLSPVNFVLFLWNGTVQWISHSVTIPVKKKSLRLHVPPAYRAGLVCSGLVGCGVAWCGVAWCRPWDGVVALTDFARSPRKRSDCAWWNLHELLKFLGMEEAVCCGVTDSHTHTERPNRSGILISTEPTCV